VTGDLGSGTEALVAALQDRYRIERELGRGGMATVYVADDIRHHRRVAIKVLRPELAAVVGGERFLREIRTTATLQHSHILGLIDSGELGGLPYYVMPFVDGESLRNRLTREHQLPVADAVRIAKEVASALDYAHRHGVVTANPNTRTTTSLPTGRRSTWCGAPPRRGSW
jgi:serine/threonine-protein kinase